MLTDKVRQIGVAADDSDVAARRERMQAHIHLRLASMGYEAEGSADAGLIGLADDLLRSYQERSRLLLQYLCPVDQRIQTFLDEHLAPVGRKDIPRLPSRTLVLDRHGMARELSLPRDGDEFHSECLESYRLRNGVLHNPVNDRRTTKGSFHVAEGGLPIPADKLAVPQKTFLALLRSALNPPKELMLTPYTADLEQPLHSWVSLLLRPVICPEVPGYMPEKSMEIRFFAPASLVSNLDFVESIFGNAGDPELPENDAALDVEHWSGQTGCVILAPQLTTLRKCDVGLPTWDDATEEQRAKGLCWKERDELYNDGQAFKMTCRTTAGVVVTLIADNYYGYCKKEVKTQISYAANFYGLCEEEHAGGAIAYASYALGDEYAPGKIQHNLEHNWGDVAAKYGAVMDLQPEGYGIDSRYPEIIYVPETARFDLPGLSVTWQYGDSEQRLKLLPDKIYVYPTGYRVRMEKHPAAPSWRLVGTVAEGTFCHKPCTVSGGGKSEISKNISDAFLFGSFYVANLEEDMVWVDEIINRDYSDRFRPGANAKSLQRPILSPERSLGSVIKLLTPSPTEFTDEYNAWLNSIPQHIRALVFIIKRFHRPDWGDTWREHFTVDEINGWPAHELKYDARKLVAIYLRVGLKSNGAWRTYKLRQDFIQAEKLQMEDDISASIVAPVRHLGPLNEQYVKESVKLVQNCEYRFFQRPDEAIVRGFDGQAEGDIARRDNFIVNYQPLTADTAQDLVEDAMVFSEYTEPMQTLIRETATLGEDAYFVASDQPRLVNGVPSKNPRYLQTRPDVLDDRRRYLATMCARLRRRADLDAPIHFPVNAVLGGRRNNPPDKAAGIRPLAVYNPIHYQELPELFMDFVCSLTGKSPSTTGAGSEGALTKGPFNCLCAVSDLNNALVSYILTGDAGFTSAAGFVGPNYRVEHDVSLLIPELWCRLDVKERDPKYLIENGFLEKLNDFEYDGKPVLASRLGYRINANFARHFFGRVFDNPIAVFNDDMLRPEIQDLESYVDGIHNITEAQTRVAKLYFVDGSVEGACPPLKAILHLMAHGHWEGKDASNPEFRAMFTREYLLASDWYRERLFVKQQRDIRLWERHVAALKTFLRRKSHTEEAERLKLRDRLVYAKEQQKKAKSMHYLEELHGTLGADPIFGAE